MAEERIKSRIAELKHDIEELQTQMEPHQMALRKIATAIDARGVLISEFEKILQEPPVPEPPKT